jgi:hypothetical protein
MISSQIWWMSGSEKESRIGDPGNFGNKIKQDEIMR